MLVEIDALTRSAFPVTGITTIHRGCLENCWNPQIHSLAF